MLISTATANPVLTALFTKFMQDTAGLVGLQIAPIFLTGQQAAKYYVFDKDNMMTVPRGLERAPGTPYKRTMLKLSDDSFSCSNKGIEIPVDDEERDKYASAFSADEAAMKRARNIIMMNHEIRVRDMATGSSTPTSAVTSKWDDYGNNDSNPVYDLDVVKEVIRLACGLDANLFVMPRKVFNVLKEHPKILEKIKYSQRAVVTVEILQEVFGIPKIAIAGAIENTAADGQAVSPDYVWGDSVWIGHVETSSDLQAPNFARTFVWTSQTGADGVMVESYREDKIQSDIHRAKQFTDEKVTGSEMGYHLSDTLA